MPRKELLVALLPKIEALDRLKTEGWYHIPVETAPKRWPPEVMAFYQGKIFGLEERYKIRYFGKLAIETDGYTTHYDSLNQIDYDTWRRNEIELDDWRFLHYTTKQVKDDRTPYLTQITTKIEQLGGLESPVNFRRKIGEERAQYIVDGEDPF